MNGLNRRSFLQMTAGMTAAGFTARAPRAADATHSSLGAIYEAAKGEQELSYYAAANLNISNRVVKAFNQRYPGIKVNILRLATSQLAQRFVSEHQAGNYASDLIQLSDPFVLRDAAAKGWLAPISELPAVASYPSNSLTKHSAMIGIAPHTIVVNTDLVPEADRPRNWRDLLNPKWKGQIILSDPRNNLEVADWLYTIYEAYGEKFLAELASQKPKYVPSILPGLQMLAAGDGRIVAPALHQATMVMLSRGAPVSDFSPALTSGQESLIAVCAHAKSPSSARLLANFLLTREGQGAYCADWAASPLGSSIPGALKLSDQHQRARYDKALKKRAELVSLLGL
jgi:iron(III) transport system substrate-binding protein